MLNRANTGIFFKKTKGQLETIITGLKEVNKQMYFADGASKFFSDDALKNLLITEGLLPSSSLMILTVANQKGGVAKTSTSLSQARNLADVGFKTLLIDTDSQSNATKSLVGEKGQCSLFDVITGEKRIEDVIIKLEDGFHLLPANDNCSRIDFILTDSKFVYNPANYIRNLVKNLGYQFIVIDTSPSFSSINIACIASSNRVLCPVPLSDWEVDGLEQVAKVVGGLNNRLGTNVELDFVITKFSKSETKAFEEISKIKKMNGHLYNTLIPQASVFKQAQKNGKLENKGRAYKETLLLTREIVEQCSRG